VQWSRKVTRAGGARLHLIHKEVPVGLFINPVRCRPGPGGVGRSTRSFEYDTLNDSKATRIIDAAGATHAGRPSALPDPE
jgi:hypothetical protein